MDCYLPECCKSLLEFTLIELSIAVEVHTLKDYLKSTDSDTAFLLNGELEFKVKLTDHYILIHTVEGHPIDVIKN